MRRAATLVVGMLLLSMPALAHHGDVQREAGEGQRAALDAAGQRNGIPEAIANGGADEAGIPVLDALWVILGTTAAHTVAEAPPFSVGHGGPLFNLHRDTQGAMPDLIPPGPGYLLAWRGLWRDVNGNGIIDTMRAETGFGPEWTPDPRTPVHAYLSPGSHPPVSASSMPDDGTPDVDLRYWSQMGLYLSGTDSYTRPIVMSDGSLLQTYFSETVSQAILSPSETSGRPYTLGPESLLDIDVYAVLAPAPVASLYAAAFAPLVNAVGSPSTGATGDASVVPLPAPGATSGPLGLVQGTLFPRRLHETAEDARSSSSGRADDFKEAFRGFLDVVPGAWRPGASTRQLPLTGRDHDGGATAGPGFLVFDIWAGAWRDFNEDGFIGVAASPDPYENGNRPSPDRPLASAGEFVGAWAKNLTSGASGNILLRIRAIPAWPEGGAFLLSRTTGLPQTATTWQLAGDRTLTSLTFLHFPEKGHYYSNDMLFLPRGADNFAIEVCSEGAPGDPGGPRAIVLEADGASLEDVVYDCDVLVPLPN
ncbi:MAG TPA: hypothetical protein VM889_06315 [Candidatus Thermoplasmatota archaeon]|nr:hypothetical protein [Candidatus Thermoplasmatota archaeon]